MAKHLAVPRTFVEQSLRLADLIKFGEILKEDDPELKVQVGIAQDLASYVATRAERYLDH